MTGSDTTEESARQRSGGDGTPAAVRRRAGLRGRRGASAWHPVRLSVPGGHSVAWLAVRTARRSATRGFDGTAIFIDRAGDSARDPDRRRCRLSGPGLDAAPAAVVIIDGIEVDGEPAGANGAGRSRSGRVPDGHVSTGSLSVDESNDSGAKREFGVVDVVDEHVVASSQRIPLELQHHAARSSAPSKTWSHGLQSHHSGVRVRSRVGSPGNIWRQRQHRRSGTPIEGSTGIREGTGCPSSWPSWRRSCPSATCRSRCWFGGPSLGMAPLSCGRFAADMRRRGPGDAPRSPLVALAVEPVELPERLRSRRHVESFRAPQAAGELRRTGGLSPSYARLDDTGKIFLETWS